jgi:hypothetical protein
MIALTLLAAAAASPLSTASQLYRDCVTAQTVQLGAANHEPAETILTAVRTICLPQWVAVRRILPSNTGVPAADIMGGQLLDSIKERAEGQAVAALLEARAARP